MKRFIFFLVSGCIAGQIMAQEKNGPSRNQFRQMRTEFATPNAYRTASGAPGQLYWQQEANYRIRVTLDDAHHKISGRESIEYVNHSPDELAYLWVQLDQNIRQKGSLSEQVATSALDERVPFSALGRLMSGFEGGFHLEYIRDSSGNPLPHTVNYTMMRVDLPAPLQSGERCILEIGWWYNINDRMRDGGGRSGMEYFDADGNYIYAIAQFFPRMAVYSDVEGWQTNQFLGRTEFALPFGDYEVEITVPADHVVGATGVLRNPEEVLSEAHLQKYRQARHTFDHPVIIVSEEEARAAVKKRSGESKTWKFRAEKVRDFAFVSSRRFIWDAMAVQFGERTVLAESLYPGEGNPLWEKYSTRVVAHTLKVYSRHTFAYPYPVAYSVHCTSYGGMEYPMICFNGGRPEPDGTYSERTKWGMIGVVIHEVGHNFFPMIVNSDERQWTWMDEGLNTFLEGIAEREWDHDWPEPAGRPRDLVGYMSGDPSGRVPVMTNGELLKQFSNNAYDKPAAGLTILRETILGRELFDFAFRQYARRWMFKHPAPEDFFRTMEDASGVDLDWFWRGWFYGTDPVDISLDRVTLYRASGGDPAGEKAFRKMKQEEEPEALPVTRNRETMKSVVEADPSMRDFYDDFDEFAPTDADRETYRKYLSGLTPQEKAWLASATEKYFYQLDFSNQGGMVMPLILRFEFTGGEPELIRIPAQIWSSNNREISKVFIFDRPVASVTLDPFLETSDINTGNNQWPRRIEEKRFELYKRSYRDRSVPNPMQEQ
jgi:hypothetical protein